jgi:nitrate/TMAO reductase-like tetraheme cytochrome c subunit
MRARKLIVLAIAAIALSATAAGAADYIGASKCKMCHKLQYTSWEGLAHAKAFDVLKGDEQSNAECLKCHATGGSAEMPGVQCEACHGPGSDYKSMKVMKDPDASAAAGLVLPDEATCKGCHEGAPHEQPAFDYAEAVKQGVHEHKQ